MQVLAVLSDSVLPLSRVRAWMSQSTLSACLNTRHLCCSNHLHSLCLNKLRCSGHLFFNSVADVGSVLSSSCAADVAVLSSCCGSETLVLVLIGLVLAIAVADVVS